MSLLLKIGTMDHTGQCSFCLDLVPSTNAIIYGENKKICQNIFEVSKRFLGKEISGRDSFDWGQSEVLLSPFCALCFKTAHKIHQTQQELKSIQEDLNQLVKKFKTEVKERASKNAEDISVAAEIREDNEDEDYIKEEVVADEFEQSEDDDFHIAQSEEDIGYSDNESDNVFHPDDDQFDAANTFEASSLENADSNQKSYSQWPRVVLERLQFDENGKALNPYLVKRAEDSSGRRKRKAAINAASNLKKIIKSMHPNDSSSEAHPIESNSLRRSLKANPTPMYTSPHVYIVVENEPDGLYCDICGRPFDYQAILSRHKLSHNGEHEKPIKCPTCGKGFNLQINARRHSIVHENEKSHECKTCGKHFKTGHLKKHLESHRKDLPFGCVQCGRRFKLRKALILHKAIHDGKVYSCGLCSKDFKSQQSLEIHRSVLHRDQGEKIPCKVCGKKYGKEYMLIHEACHESIIKCPICSKTLKSKPGLQLHIKSHSEKLFDCSSCDKRFSTRNGLQIHLAQVHDNKECKCQTCGKILKNDQSLKLHMRAVHADRAHPCEICGKSFRMRKTLTQHIDIVHNRNLRYSCATCGKSFGISGNLKRHEEQHKTDLERTKFKCGICEDKYYTTMALLVAHQKQWHTVFTNGPITCDKCGNKFEGSSALFIHSRKLGTHHQHKCSFCQDLFFTRCELLVHSAEDHSSKVLPHKCKTCHIVFNGELALKKHAASKHGFVRRNPNAPTTGDDEMVHQCGICGKIMQTAKGLINHTAFHSKPGWGNRMWQCDVCGKNLHKDGKMRHMDLHSGETYLCCAFYVETVLVLK